MADAVNVTTIEDGERQLVVQLTNLSVNQKLQRLTCQHYRQSQQVKLVTKFEYKRYGVQSTDLMASSFSMMLIQTLLLLALAQTGHIRISQK